MSKRVQTSQTHVYTSVAYTRASTYDGGIHIITVGIFLRTAVNVCCAMMMIVDFHTETARRDV